MLNLYPQCAFAILGLVHIGIAGCAQPVSTPRQQLLNEDRALWFEQDTSRQVWRTYSQGENNTIIHLGKLPQSPAILIGGRLDSMETGPGQIEVWVENKRVGVVTLNFAKWSDRRFTLDDDLTGQNARLEITGDPVLLGPVDVFSVSHEKPSNVLVLMVDTFRLDHLGIGGYHRNTSPNIDALAEDAVFFSQMMPPSSWTRPSVASFLTGTMPQRHGIVNFYQKLRENLPSLPRAFEEAGYATYGLSGNGVVSPRWRMGMDFEVFERAAHYEDDVTILDAAKTTIGRNSGRKWFMYVHLFGPHYPYNPPDEWYTKFQPVESAMTRDQIVAWLDQGGLIEEEIYRKLIGVPDGPPRDPHPEASKWSHLPIFSHDTLVERLKDLYDGQIAYTDAAIGEFIQFLKDMGLYENMTLIMLSDHGEEFYEHGGFQHGKTLYEEQLRVPLLIKLPHSKNGGTRVDDLVRMVDVPATILELAEIPAPRGFEGRSFIDALVGKPLKPTLGYAVVSKMAPEVFLETAKTVERKLLLDRVKKRQYWYDLVKDSAELTPRERPKSWPDARLLEARLAAEEAMRHRAGMYFLLSSDWAEEYEFRLEISMPDGVALELLENRVEVRIRRSDEQWRIYANAHADERRKKNWWPSLLAILWAFVEPDKEIEIGLFVNGEPSPITLHRAAGVQPSEETARTRLIPADVLVAPGEIHPYQWPLHVGVHVWYEPPREDFDDSLLDTDDLRQLEALGYVG